MVLLLLVIIIPEPTGFIIMGSCLAGLGFIAYSAIVLHGAEVTTYTSYHHQVSSSSFKICLIILTIIAFVVTILLMARRIKKFKHLSPLMKIVQTVILSNLPSFPLVMLFGLNLVCLLLWVAFSKILWICLKMQYS